ncbi:hypothetical protein CF319_g6090 [Tilletia indica]|uniref:Cytochrome c oxidase copper chaperone n=1 Tax=Tilletia walkeri TaxID=117179 RepID=A0A8X7NHF4_9BASI|nr:hypothetical protein CF327_g800 [Tilletia walkeri]KAE8220377.1 hypothetical protein CF319_g6090 [Tilletia indica]KAE8272220.1 hypothetical protein A4X09_0g94 [Tilletia walkeri]
MAGANELSTLTSKSNSNNNNTPNKFVTELNPKGIKPCCACPDTKSVRDECFLKHGGYDGEAAEEKCKNLVAAHRACMAKLGYQI